MDVSNFQIFGWPSSGLSNVIKGLGVRLCFGRVFQYFYGAGIYLEVCYFRCDVTFRGLYYQLGDKGREVQGFRARHSVQPLVGFVARGDSYPVPTIRVLVVHFYHYPSRGMSIFSVQAQAYHVMDPAVGDVVDQDGPQSFREATRPVSYFASFAMFYNGWVPPIARFGRI